MGSLNEREVPVEGKDDDRRYLPRWDVNNRILCKIEDTSDVYECRSMDLSCAGACLISQESVPANQKVRLTLYLAEDHHVDVNGHVVWSRPAQHGNLMGIMFDETQVNIQETILDYAFEVKKQDVQKHWFNGWNNSNGE